VKRNLAINITALTLLAALAVPVQLAAQDKQDHQHHHYHLVDLGSTFGGTQSYFNPGSGNDFGQFTSVLNRGGSVAGFADTSVSDPFPNLCFWDCNVVHAFRAGREGGLTDLGALPGGGSSVPTWITTNGLIAGVSENGETDPLYAGLPEFRAVLWERGRLTDLGTLPQGGYQSAANSVNSSGQVVGAALNTISDINSMQPGASWLPGEIGGYQYQTRAFLWDKQKGMQDLGTLPGGTDAEAMLINERGQVVGNSYTSSAPSALCAGAGFALTTGSFMWEKNRGMVDLGNLGGTCTLVTDLNNRGKVIGESSLVGDQSVHDFIWEHGVLQDLGGSLGGDFTGAFVLNDQGEAVGFAYFPGDIMFHATLWKHVGEMTDLGAVGNDPCSFATGINARGQVVGGSKSTCDPEGGSTRAFLWEDGSILDLNALIPSGSGLHLESTYTINDRSEIAGEGVDDSGNGHAFLLIPCDENHPDVDGCDYSLADASTSAKTPTPPDLSIRMMRLRQSWPTNRYNNPGPGLRKAALNGKAATAAPIATLSPTSLAFSAQALGTTSPAKTVTLKNTGTATLTMTAVAITGTDAGDFAQTHTCGTSLAPGASCQISVKFKPTVSGTRTAALSITNNAAGSPQHVPLSGVGTTAKLSLSSLNFGTLAIGTASPAKTITLTNVGTTTLTIIAIAITGTNAGDFSQTTTCGTSLAAGVSCKISAEFKPEASGTRTAALGVSDNVAGNPQKVPLIGIGTTAKLSPTSLSFGSVAVGSTSPPQTVTLTNLSTTSLSITDIAITGNNAGDFAQTHTCGSSLAAGASCSISVTFKPTDAFGGTRTAALSVSDNAAGSPQKVFLSGIEACPAVLCSSNHTQPTACGVGICIPGTIHPIYKAYDLTYNRWCRVSFSCFAPKQSKEQNTRSAAPATVLSALED